jgi:16S rRNA (cytidine1402-2'-O)-methyltransferase
VDKDIHTLYVVATPIGNLEDITLRALRILKEVSLIAAEDTRKAHVLLSHYEITTPVTSFFEANEYRKTPVILSALEQGPVALISEAGMPGISDPGYPLITAAIEMGVKVVPVPGPSAHTAALVASGLPTDRFLFVGFLPRKRSSPALEELATVMSTMVFYEAPHRLRATLEAMCETFGNRRLALGRELTKLHEEIWRGDLEEALAWLDTQPPRGEYTLVVAGASEEDLKWSEQRVRRALLDHMARGLSRSRAAREVASLSGWPRRKVYDLPVDRDPTASGKR